MATAAVENKTIDFQSDIFNCPICLERLRKPKYLPCLHTFCDSCIHTYIVSMQNGHDSSKSFDCPVCRQKTHPTDPNSPREDWASLLPLNHMIFSLMEQSGYQKNENETICGPCEKDEETAPATFRCIECFENLCDNCKKFHNRLVSRKHNVVPIEQVQDRSRKITDIDEPCPIHNGELLKVYCLDHHKMCCVICLAVIHRECKNIKTFDEMAGKRGILNLSEKMREIGSKVETFTVSKKNNIDKIEKQQQEIFQQASSLVEKAKQKLDKYLTDFKTKFSQIHKEQITKLSDAKEKLENFHKTLSNGEKMMRAVSEHGSSKQLFIASEKLKAQLEVQGEELTICFEDDHEVDYDVTMDNQLTTMATSISAIADVKLTITPCSESAKPVFNGLSALLAMEDQNFALVDIADLKAVKIWDAKGDGWFTGGLFLKDERLLFCDNNNEMVHMFDSYGNVISDWSLDYKPWGVAQNSGGEILVSGSSSKSINIYTLSKNNFSCIRSINTPGSVRAIEVLGTNIVLEWGSKIHMMTARGQVLNTVYKSQSNSYIAISESSSEGDSEFYYCDGKDIICRAQHGKETLRYSLTGIKSPRGIALDKSKNIYVCDRESNSVHLIAKNGEKSRIFMSNLENITEPYGIGFNNTGTLFFVTAYKFQKNVNDIPVAVYQLRI